MISLFLVVVVVSIPLAWEAKERQARKNGLLALATEASVSPHVTYGRDREIYLALERNVSLDLNEAPIQEIAHTLGKLAGIPIIVDTRALDDAGLGPDAPVTVNVREETLHRILRDLELVFAVQDGVLLISTPESFSKSGSRVRIYNVAHLLGGDRDATRLASVLHEALTRSSRHDARTEYVGAFEHLLVVCASSGGHHQLAKTLEMLKAGMRP